MTKFHQEYRSIAEQCKELADSVHDIRVETQDDRITGISLNMVETQLIFAAKRLQAIIHEEQMRNRDCFIVEPDGTLRKMTKQEKTNYLLGAPVGFGGNVLKLLKDYTVDQNGNWEKLSEEDKQQNEQLTIKHWEV